MRKLYTLILAAGMGKRMRSDLPKVIHKINNRELVKYVIDQAKGAGSDDIWLIVGHKKEMVIEATKNLGVNYTEQKEQLGTGHAVMQAESPLEGKTGDVLILCGDVPLLRVETLLKFREFHEKSGCSATVMTTEFDDPFGYGRIVKDPEGNIIKIVEEKDAEKDEKKIKEINSGVYIIDKNELFGSLKNISSDNAGKEYYLTDVIGIMKGRGKKIGTYKISDNTEIQGINTLEQLSIAEGIMNSRNK
ncbi:MAG: NTP transferase domain-containing protein [Candidatus Delongbacteria bacterium]|jgi:UDP-N-acetylglucosamine diphosphorylase/glucosamine-1-phosphate N-acetyltransferase|nr:NTP transferase domain-containing protein [Candidatus Delongbacteria bacterium]